MNLFALTDKEQDIVIAALRLWQSKTFNQIPASLLEIATNGREDGDMLSDSDIDILIEGKLNAGGLNLGFIRDDTDEKNDLFIVKSESLTPMEIWHSYYPDLDTPDEYAVCDITLNGKPGAVGWYENSKDLDAGVITEAK